MPPSPTIRLRKAGLGVTTFVVVAWDRGVIVMLRLGMTAVVTVIG